MSAIEQLILLIEKLSFQDLVCIVVVQFIFLTNFVNIILQFNLFRQPILKSTISSIFSKTDSSGAG